MRKHFSLVLVLVCALLSSRSGLFAQQAAAAPNSQTLPSTNNGGLDLRIPLESNSVRFAVIGDSGTGQKEQYEVAQQMENYRKTVKFDFVIMLGDNIYGGHKPQDFVRKFEAPYKPLLDAGVKFYAALGNHDNPNDERLYKPFNMNGERYYFFKKGDVAFFVLDSNYMDAAQLNWLQSNLRNSQARWKISYFHHPMYSNARFHGPDLDLRARLSPIFEANGVDAVFSGHEHVYERVQPVRGIHFFMLGNSGQLRYKNLRPARNTVAGFDTDRTFMLVEIAGDKLYFQVISRSGQTVDSGVVERTQRPKSSAAAAP